jgi:acyl-CoA thioester hydrolase
VVTPEPPPTDPAAYRHWTADIVRFSDQNREGHINSVAVATYIESARVAFAADLRAGLADEDALLMLVRLAIDYLAEAHHPGAIDVGTRLLRVGRTSLTLGHGVFKDGRCIATAEAVLVRARGGASTPVDGPFRARLERLLAG